VRNLYVGGAGICQRDGSTLTGTDDHGAKIFRGGTYREFGGSSDTGKYRKGE
jgi:hypothetical protein